MMEMKIWNRLCDKVNKKINVSEGRFEKEIALEFLGALNWSEYYDNLKEQYQIDVHGDKWIPDFALFAEGQDEPDIIVELKKPSHKQRTKDRRQITTYMKLVDCRFGLYFGEKLELFYLDYEPEKRVSKSVLSVDFVHDDKSGQRLIDLLKYDTYDRSKLRTFCENQLKLNGICNYWCSKEGLDRLYAFIIAQSDFPNSLAESLRLSLEISVTQKKKVETSDESSEEDSSAVALDSVSSAANKEDYTIFRLTEPVKGTDATMYFYSQERKYVIKAGSKVSTNETKDCSPMASKLRKAVFSDQHWAKEENGQYVLLRDVVIVPKTGAPNVSAHFCTGRSTNAQTAWVSKDGKTFAELFSKTTPKEEEKEKNENPDSDINKEPSFLSECVGRVAKETGYTLTRKSGNAYISSDGKQGYVFRTSKVYPQGEREKFWYAYKRTKELSECKNQYYVFGCKDAGTIIILPISDIEAQINGLNYSHDENGKPLYWHIVFLKDKNGKINWLISKPEVHEIDITSKLL